MKERKWSAEHQSKRFDRFSRNGQRDWPDAGTYQGPINGYAVVENGTYPAQAVLINQWVNSATAVRTTSRWSTDRIAPPTGGQQCSQAFTLKPGVYYFGNLDNDNFVKLSRCSDVATPAPNLANKESERIAQSAPHSKHTSAKKFTILSRIR